MYPIIHRVNTLKELGSIPLTYGIEIDVRDHGDHMILQHDPFTEGESFEAFLQSFKHKTLIVNVKSERIEPEVIRLLDKYAISDYFFLDSSFPMLFTLASQGVRNLAILFSEYESIETVKNMKSLVSWIWIDCLTKLPLDREVYMQLKETKLKLCLVSPDLLGRENEIEAYKDFLLQHQMNFDAVCTKIHNVSKWF